MKQLDKAALDHGYVLVPVQEYTGLLVSENEANYYRDYHRQDSIGERLMAQVRQTA